MDSGWLLLRGLGTTLQFGALSAAMATLVAIAVGTGLAHNSRATIFLRVYVELFRGSSLVVQLFWLYYVLPHFGLVLSPQTAGVLALSLNSAAYGAEAVRGAIRSVPVGQWEAARTLGLRELTVWSKIILPQTLRLLVPQWATFLIEIFKATSVLSIISITELTFIAYQVTSRTYDTVRVFSIVLMLYFIVSQLISFGVRRLDEHINPLRRDGEIRAAAVAGQTA